MAQEQTWCGCAHSKRQERDYEIVIDDCLNGCCWDDDYGDVDDVKHLGRILRLVDFCNVQLSQQQNVPLAGEAHSTQISQTTDARY